MADHVRTYENGETEFPVIIELDSTLSMHDTNAWIAGQRNELVQQLAERGVTLFRGFPIKNANDFDTFVGNFELPNFPYEKSLSNAVRVNKTDRVFTANEAPADIEIFLHHEMAQTPIYPTKIFFCCLDAPDTGGATPICRSDWLLKRLRVKCPQFVRDCETKGLKYSNVMPGADDMASGMGRSWQSTLSADSKATAENCLRELGYSWEWVEDDCLRATTPVLPAIRRLSNGRSTFFNQLIAAFKGWKDLRNDPSKSICHGDDSPLDRDAVHHAIEIAYDITYDVAWQNGDVAFVDNLMVMHGRRPFTGSRTVLASLAAAEKHGQ